jgi:hypothetical protein
VAREIKRCRSDFRYFSRKYLKITDKNGSVVHLKPNNAQERYLDALQRNPWVYVLKSRKLGLTTIIAAVNFWDALFTPNHATLVLAHTDTAAKSIFRIYTRFYESLPSFLQFDLKLQNKHEMMFEHGGYIVAATAGSDSARGSTYQSIHCSEFAMYEDIESLIAAALSTAGNNPRVALETTANGLNDAHKIWYSPNGYEKVFISWLDAEDSRRKKKPAWVPKEIQDLGVQYELDPEQIYWATETYLTRCAANWNTFQQEYPAEAHLAFISSGKRFFNITFPHAKSSEGYRSYADPLKYRAYVIGVDVASGSDHGDFSAFCTIDATDKKKPRIVSTFYKRMAPAEFTQAVLAEAKKYDALVCVESNSYGLSVLEGLVSHDWGNLYRRVKYDRVGKRWTENLGFNTNVSTRSILMAKIQEYVSRKWLYVLDETLKAEMNSFVFNRKGKPCAETGKHDNMIIATCLALVAMEQVDAVRPIKTKAPPSTVREMLEFEIQTGRTYNESRGMFPGSGSAEGRFTNEFPGSGSVH